MTIWSGDVQPKPIQSFPKLTLNPLKIWPERFMISSLPPPLPELWPNVKIWSELIQSQYQGVKSKVSKTIGKLKFCYTANYPLSNSSLLNLGNRVVLYLVYLVQHLVPSFGQKFLLCLYNCFISYLYFLGYWLLDVMSGSKFEI